MARFKSAFKGYDKKEVDEYLHKTTEYHESKMRELEECVKRLKEENDYLYAKNTEYHRNEERVSGAILKAMQVKTDLEKELRIKISLEEDRLRIFKTKWIAYARGLNHANADRVVEDIDGYVATLRRDFIERATRELDLPDSPCSSAEKSYLQEQARIRSLKSTPVSLAEGEKMSAASLVDKDEGEAASSDKCGFYEE